MQTLQTLYPPFQPNNTYRLAVTPPHEIYIEESGNPAGIPILYVHGGPGTGASEDSRRYFDPKIYRIILFDQRGSGRSTPTAELKNNTTQDLIADMEAIRKMLQIEKWILFGGSWGSTLSLIYAETYSQHVNGLILRGIFLGRLEELSWLYSHDGGAREIFPDYWEDFLAPIPKEYRHSPLPFYSELLNSNDKQLRLKAARSWSLWEGRMLSVQPRPDLVEKISQDDTAINFARIGCHYMMNDCFLEHNQILRDINKIQNLPGIIVQGRYDIVCPLISAWDLHKAWPKSQLKIIEASGHSSSEPGITDGLITATQTIINLIK